jgi:hypothetical protein
MESVNERVHTRGSSPRNKRTAEFHGARQDFQAPRPRSRVARHDRTHLWTEPPCLDGAKPRPHTRTRHDTQTRAGITLTMRGLLHLRLLGTAFTLMATTV